MKKYKLIKLRLLLNIVLTAMAIACLLLIPYWIGLIGLGDDQGLFYTWVIGSLVMCTLPLILLIISVSVGTVYCMVKDFTRWFLD